MASSIISGDTGTSESSTTKLRRLKEEQLVFHRINSDAKLSQIQHQTLQSEENIRLLKVSITEVTVLEKVFRYASYDIVERPLAEVSGQFVAISYRWGILRPDRGIPLANTNYLLLVTRTVKTMLEHIVGDLDAPYIWIDAICIDQGNKPEKNSQVSMMGSIFRHAKSVRVWLGRTNDEPSESSLWHWLKLLLRWERNIQNSLSGASNREEMDKYLRLILQSEWFERVWVVQEVCLAKEVMFHYGKIVISMERLHDVVIERLKYPHTAALVDQNQTGPNDLLLASFSVLQEFSVIRSLLKHGKRSGLRSLSKLYGSFASQKATDPRDNVYAFLGIIHPAYLGGIKPDYNASVDSVYIDTMFRMINVEQELSMLGYAGLARSGTRISSMRRLPTWVHDFSDSPTADVWSRHKAFNASPVGAMEPIKFSLIPSSDPNLAINPDLIYSRASIPSPLGTSALYGCISLKGAIFDIVAGTGAWPKVNYENNTPSPFGSMAKKNMYGTVREIYEKADELCPYPTDESGSTLWWKVLIANLDGVELATSLMLEDAKAFVANLIMYDYDRAEKWAALGFESWKVAPLSIETYARTVLQGHHNKYADNFARSGAGHSRRMLWTKRGYLGLAKDGVKAGDMLCIFPGARVPFVIRGPVARIAERCYYHLVCEAYIHGVMHGELGQSDYLIYETVHIM